MSFVDFTKAPVAGDLNVRWIHGSPSYHHSTDPPIQVHPYDAHTIIMRQSKDVSFEAPFMYLFFGNDRALLLDTGATADSNRFPLRATIDRLITDWLVNHPRVRYELIVAHTHGHNDHTAGDSQFFDRPDTRVIPKDLDSVKSFFNISNWPVGIGRYDLGGRALDILPTPGHDPRSISVYDQWTGLLVTGDIVYPGRLYAFDFPAFIESLNRLVSYAERTPVTHVMGCHIEMTRTSGKDYPATTKYQPNERPLEMTLEQLTAVRDAAESVRTRHGAHTFPDFIIFNGPCYGAVGGQLVRAAWANLLYMCGIV
jgi:glyoxylase-like metal-dependent hydrolase (beta-lactamase superfamily II)